jgi:hypothetical protein
LYSRINDYFNNTFELQEYKKDEDKSENLRKSPNDIYYLEKMKVFKETFGID